jgi:hypothetical protein
MRKIFQVIAVVMLMSSSVLAAGVEVKWSGPSGQGDMTFWNPTNSSTNLVLTSTGNVTIPNTLTAGTITAGVTNVVRSTGMAVLGNQTISGTLTVTGAVAAVSSATVGTTLGVTGLATLNNLIVNTNATITGQATIGTALVTTLNVTNTLGTAGAVAGLMTNAPASTTADAVWAPIKFNGVEYYVPLFKKN